MFSSGWRKTEPLDLKRGRGALPEEEGFRKSLCSVILQSVNESPYNELRVPSTWWKGALDLPGSSGSAAGCSQTWGRTGTFVFILHLKPPGAFWFECDQTPAEWGDFLPSSHLPTENTPRRELLNSLGIRDNLPGNITGVKSSLKWTWWWSLLSTFLVAHSMKSAAYSLLPLIPQVLYGHSQIMKNRVQIHIWNVYCSEYLFKVL